MAQLIDGKLISQQIKDELKEEVAQFKAEGIDICLAVIQVGSDPASSVYVRNKKKACAYIGVESRSYELPEETSEEELIKLVEELNADGLEGITLKYKKGSDITLNSGSIIKDVANAIGASRNGEYKVDSICKLDEVANNTYLQSMFTVELANFLHYYFPVKRKKDSLVSTDEQDMIIKILHLFKLTPYLVVRSRYRQLLMLADRFKENLSWINLQDQLLPVTFIKWKQWNTNNWLEVEYDKLKEGETVSFPPLGSNN